MPMMVALTNFRLATTTGHTLFFTANEPRFVPDDAVTAAQYRGASVVGGAPFAGPDDDAKLRTGFAIELRQSLLALLMQRMIKENSPKNFDAGGMPKIDVLAKALGFDVDRKEQRAVWQKVMSCRANGETLDLHKDAKDVLDIIDAESKSDLLLLANEKDVPAEEVAGLSARDLRRKLLAKYAGLTTG